MQARAHPRQEVGGLLVGAVYQEGERFLVAVRTALPGRHTWAGQAFLTFTGRTWIDLVRRRRAYPESVVVGWYHSHPGLGIFLSSNDRFIHRSFFADYPWYLALVVDPISGWWGTFTWDNGEIVSCVEGFTGRSPAGKRRN
jgi:proteasome lid subunit RPN8/RPN11